MSEAHQPRMYLFVQRRGAVEAVLPLVLQHHRRVHAAVELRHATQVSREVRFQEARGMWTTYLLAADGEVERKGQVAAWDVQGAVHVLQQRVADADANADAGAGRGRVRVRARVAAADRTLKRRARAAAFFLVQQLQLHLAGVGERPRAAAGTQGLGTIEQGAGSQSYEFPMLTNENTPT